MNKDLLAKEQRKRGSRLYMEGWLIVKQGAQKWLKEGVEDQGAGDPWGQEHKQDRRVFRNKKEKKD